VSTPITHINKSSQFDGKAFIFNSSVPKSRSQLLLYDTIGRTVLLKCENKMTLTDKIEDLNNGVSNRPECRNRHHQ